MPNLEWNRSTWDGDYCWTSGGEEWSQAWGGSEAQWFGALYPRLHRALPARAIFEIAPGFGRWTKFLLPLCETYVGVDLSATCVQACRKTFATADHAEFLQNDGISLSEVPDAKFDLVFCFDSLVHVAKHCCNLSVAAGGLRLPWPRLGRPRSAAVVSDF